MNPRGIVPGILVAHGRLAEELKSTAESIAGAAPDILCLSNEGKSPEGLAADVLLAVGGIEGTPVVLVDLAGGSCLAAVRRALRERPDINVVAGMNLPLVLDFLQNRGSLSGDELIRHLLERGCAGIRQIGGE